MSFKAFLLISLLMPFRYAFSQEAGLENSYRISKPCAFYTLPDSLYEISGLTDVDSSHIGCVQDEKGIVFLYNLREARIDSRFTFNFDGDYEGITKVRNDMFVLRSDGYLFRINNYMHGSTAKRDSFATSVPITNNEGLCYDEKNNILLIAAKGRIKKSKDMRDLRFVYGFRLDSFKIMAEPILTIDVNTVAAKMKLKGMKIASLPKKEGKVKYTGPKFMPSSIAVHPISDKLYLLSAVDKLLAIFNRNGESIDVIQLPVDLFPKPEGITFLPNGDMLISNEGNGGKANLMRFCYQ